MSDVADDLADSGLGSPGGRVTLLVVWATVAAHTFLSPNDYQPVFAAFSLSCYLACSLALTAAAAEPLARPHAALVMTTAVLASVLAIGALANRAVDQPWLLYSGTNMLALLCVRGRPAIAWAGAGAFILFVLGAASSTHMRGDVVTMILLPVCELIVGTTWRSVMNRFGGRWAALRSQQAQAEAQAHAAEVAMAEARAQLSDVARRVVPLLTAAGAEDPLSPDTRQALHDLEATIRDEIRAPALLSGPVEAAVHRARDRHVAVRLFDDRHRASVPVPDLLLERIAAAIDAQTGGEIVVRLSPEGRETRGTIVRSQGEERRLSVF